MIKKTGNYTGYLEYYMRPHQTIFKYKVIQGHSSREILFLVLLSVAGSGSRLEISASIKGLPIYST